MKSEPRWLEMGTVWRSIALTVHSIFCRTSGPKTAALSPGPLGSELDKVDRSPAAVDPSSSLRGNGFLLEEMLRSLVRLRQCAELGL